MTLPPPPWNLTAALIGNLAADLEREYPGWRVTINGRGLELVYDIRARWRAMTEEEREVERDRLVRDFIERDR